MIGQLGGYKGKVGRNTAVVLCSLRQRYMALLGWGAGHCLWWNEIPTLTIQWKARLETDIARCILGSLLLRQMHVYL